MNASSRPDHVVIAGGGVAAVECALALHDLAGDRVRLTIIAPEPEFALRPLRTAEPFARGQVRRHAPRRTSPRTSAPSSSPAPSSGSTPSSHTLLCTGEDDRWPTTRSSWPSAPQHRTAFRKAAHVHRRPVDADFNGLLADIDEGYSHTISFVVPPGTTWPLPLYELALMTAQEAWAWGSRTSRCSSSRPSPSAAGALRPLRQRGRRRAARAGQDRVPRQLLRPRGRRRPPRAAARRHAAGQPARRGAADHRGAARSSACPPTSAGSPPSTSTAASPGSPTSTPRATDDLPDQAGRPGLPTGRRGRRGPGGRRGRRPPRRPRSTPCCAAG